MRQDIPTALKIVAWLFIIGGILDAIETLVSLANNYIDINLGVINIFAGIGLLNLRPGWRIYSLVIIWLGLIIIPIVLILMITVSSPLDFKFFGQNIGYLSKLPALIFGALIYALIVWEYRVLTRSDIIKLFLLNRQNQGMDPTR